MIRAPLLLLNVFVVATCGLIYELLAGTLASYVLGDSVRQFSLCIGIYLTALGVGAWLSSFVDRSPARCFLEVELAVGLLGGLSAPLLFLAFSRVDWFQPLLFGTVFAVGTLVGLELPLLMRILREHLEFKLLVSRVLAVDYVGALVAAVLFPILLVPELGLVRTSLVFGILNGLVGFWGTWLLEPLLGGQVTLLRVRGAAVLVLLSVCLIKADYLVELAEEELFIDPVVYAKTTPYQRIVITRGPAAFRLFLNGNLQFSSADEYRYHEALVHPAMQSVRRPRHILILGGGDGLALREVLKHESVEAVTLVDLDPDMTALSERFPPLGKLNAYAFRDPRVSVVNRDAMIWLEETADRFDVAIVDFPDPNTFSLGKLYTRRFYRLLLSHLNPDGAVGIQCTSPWAAPKSYWCIVRTLQAAGFHVHPYQTAIPSFGIWGFALARPIPFTPPQQAPPGLRYLNNSIMQSMFTLAEDLAPVEADVNRLDDQVLVRYYEEEWDRFR